MNGRGYEPVIGMEIHAELNTQSKMFCGCAVTDTTTAEPNAHICPVCTGLPGALPVVNRRAVELAMLVGLALNCEINALTSFARKNYFYPDLPKGYQISQFDHPIATEGWVALDVDGDLERVRIRRAHMEEDTAKLYHERGDWISPEARTLIDFNRAGVPLLEIVSEPDIHSVEAALAYATKIRELLRYLDVNSGDMERGVLRFEANVSIRPTGSQNLGTRTEIKNLNSFRALARAVAYEVERQSALLDAGGEVEQETLGWDEAKGATYPQRSKEFAHDYRYFPEPDLPPLAIDRAWVETMRRQLPELPDAKRARFIDAYGLPISDADILVAERPLADYFEAAVAAYDGDPASVSKWIVGPLAHLMNREGVSIEEARIEPEQLAALVALVDAKTLNQNSAKEVLAEMFEHGGAPEAIVEAKGLVQISDEDRLEGLVRSLLDENPEQVQRYLDGKTSLLQWFMGQVMRETRGRADPHVVIPLLKEALAERR
jgi:aspartyl-tRNA(Asn)/glutamyl-tRNA(Gln) amidotransferase subunit B